MGSEGYITENTPKPEDFRFTEILDDTLPYKIVGYAEGRCPDAANPYGYVPPTGWFVSSCTMMPPGSHGVVAGGNTILVYCEPIKNDIPQLEDGELTSILYPAPSDRVEITGTAHAIPDGSGIYIQQANYIRYAILGKTLEQYDYYEGEPVVAILKLSPVYEDIIDLDQWGYIAEMVDVRRPSEPEKPLSETIGGKSNFTTLALEALAIISLCTAGYYVLTHKYN